MRYRNRLIEFFIFVLVVGFCFVSCAEKKEGKVIVTDQSFSIRKDGKIDWVVDARGKIRNVGDADVKNIVVTAYCRSCGEVIKSGTWFISDLEKTPVQKEVIASLAAGQEADFSFKEVAFFSITAVKRRKSCRKNWKRLSSLLKPWNKPRF